ATGTAQCGPQETRAQARRWQRSRSQKSTQQRRFQQQAKPPGSEPEHQPAQGGKTMKVKELIAILQQYDPEANVTISAEGVVREIDDVHDNGWKNNVTIANED
ncbi:MAG: hypothetical protein WBK67_04050, partial [Minisyncoccales bacterium]